MFNQFKFMFFSGLLALHESRNHMKSLGTCHLPNRILPAFHTSSMSSSSLHCRPVDAANSCKTPSIFAILATLVPVSGSAVLRLPYLPQKKTLCPGKGFCECVPVRRHDLTCKICTYVRRFAKDTCKYTYKYTYKNIYVYKYVMFIEGSLVEKHPVYERHRRVKNSRVKEE